MKKFWTYIVIAEDYNELPIGYKHRSIFRDYS